MPLLTLTCVLFVLLAVLLGGLYFLQRRQLAVLRRQQAQPPTIAEPAQPPALLFAELADRIHDAVLVHGETILHANRQFAALAGTDRAGLVGRRLADLVLPDYADLVSGSIVRCLAGESGTGRYEIELTAGDGGAPTRLEISSAVIEFEGTRALLLTGVEIAPAAVGVPAPAGSPPPAAARWAQALESLSDAIIVADGQGRVEYLNPAAVALAQVDDDPAQAQGRPVAEVFRLVDEADGRPLRDPLRHALALAPAGNARALMLPRGGGAERAVELSAAPLSEGAEAGAVLVLRDVTAQRGQARQISYQATHDALTGLRNRHEFERRLAEVVDGAARGEGHHVLCYLDLDRFKAVNDTSGHLAGDGMLRELARLLREAVRDSDVVGRLGGDEFGVLLIGCPLAKARQIADDICHKVAGYRFVWKDRLFSCGVSVGLVEISRESGSVEDVLAAADAACYVAKKEGSGRVAVYSAREEALARHSGEIQWLQRLQSALRENRFHLYRQEIVAADGRDPAGPRLEVFVRLSDDAGTDVPPGEFMRAAERHRLTLQLDRWVVQATLLAMGRGDIRLAEGQSVSINLSAQTLADEQFLEFVVECLDRTGVPPSQLCFETSEAAVSANLEAARRFIGVLHGMGCRFALDDFGSNVGSFSNLRLLQLDYLKIDGALMRNLARDSVNQAMVMAMIKLARSLKFKVIAEQVEDASSADYVRRMGVDYLQGYAIGVPRPFNKAA